MALASGGDVKISAYESELVWAAGFFDGEGNAHTYYRQNKPHCRPSLQIQISAAQIDPRPLERLQRVLGGKVYGPFPTKGPYGKPASPHWQWRIQGKRAVQSRLNKLLPHLTGAKQEQARRVLIEAQVYGPKRNAWDRRRRGGEG